ncbi:hotdog domain-containing protein, partial [Thermocrinis sp.]
MIYRRRVQFYETDAQGVMHHSNYFRLFEEARGELLRSLG